MTALIDFAFKRARTIVLLFIVILLVGSVVYRIIPKESAPDVPIPIIFVSVSYEGISVSDAERLLLRPLEKELQSVQGLKALSGSASEGRASIKLEFDAGFSAERALQDVREQIDIAKAELPPGSDEPRVKEVNVALFPVLSVALAGQLPARQLQKISRELRDKIESLPGVLEATIAGEREEVLEVIASPSTLETYNVSLSDVIALLQRNNQLVAAGALDSGTGRMVVKVPGVIEKLAEVKSLPIKVSGNTVVTFGDVASVRRTFKTPESFARVGGEKALVIDVSKRLGANIIQVVKAVREVVAKQQSQWPKTLSVSYMQDGSKNILVMLSELQNNILAAILLVMCVVIAALGLRAGVLVGLAIPGSFLVGILLLYTLGYTVNMVVLFGLILVVGMLVDGSIVTTELAERYLSQGFSPRDAYLSAAKRMNWPIIASTVTTLVVFFPLMFWPGVTGEFMKYLPITVIVTLLGSLFMALIFIPVLGSLLAKQQTSVRRIQAEWQASTLDADDLRRKHGLVGIYLRGLNHCLHHAGKVVIFALIFLVSSYLLYGKFGRGVEFFPDIDVDFIQVQVQGRGDLSVVEKDKLVRQVEAKLQPVKSIKTMYAQTIGRKTGGKPLAEDVIGVVQIELLDWTKRANVSVVMQQLRQQLSAIAGIKFQVRKQKKGPSTGKPIKLELRAQNSRLLAPAVSKIRQIFAEIGGFVDVEDSRPLPGIEWQLRVNREAAARFGADVALLGSAVQLITNGIKLTEYQPDDSDEELDIRLRFPYNDRNLEQLKQLRVPTRFGQVPIGNFIELKMAAKTGEITHADSYPSMTIEADVAKGVLVNDKVMQLKAALKQLTLTTDIDINFKGDDEKQQETARFLIKAFFAALFLMTIILVTQFNSFYQAFIVLSAIIFSTAGVLLSLLITAQPFGIVMCGIGLIALAGIVVNNNIVLIDTYNEVLASGIKKHQAILITAWLRLRPVLLTSVTTVLGLLPMVFGLTIDILGQNIAVGAPSTQWWLQLSSAIAGGLSFATVLTLILTPCMLKLRS